MWVSTIPLVGGFTGDSLARGESSDFVVYFDSYSADWCLAECGSDDEAIRHGGEKGVSILVPEQCQQWREKVTSGVRLAQATFVGSIHSG